MPCTGYRFSRFNARMEALNAPALTLPRRVSFAFGGQPAFYMDKNAVACLVAAFLLCGAFTGGGGKAGCDFSGFLCKAVFSLPVRPW